MGSDGKQGHRTASTLDLVDQIIEHVHSIAELREATGYDTERFPISATIIGGPRSARDRSSKLIRLGNTEHSLERLVEILFHGDHRRLIRPHLPLLEGTAERFHDYARMGNPETKHFMIPTPEQQRTLSGEILQILETLRVAIAQLEPSSHDQVHRGFDEPAASQESPTVAASSGQEQDCPRLKPYQARALAAWDRAVKANDSDKTDAKLYDWLEENPDESYELPSKSSWLKYVREARNVANRKGLNSPRGGRTGGSIVRSDEI